METWQRARCTDPERSSFGGDDAGGCESDGIGAVSPSCPADALTAVVPPNGLDSGVIVKAFRENFGAVVANGQGEMKGKMFRIAHLGYYDYLDTIGIIGALEHVMAER